MKHISPNLVAAELPARAPTRRALAKQQTRLKVLAAAVDRDPDSGGPPATILSPDERGVRVAAGSGSVRLIEVAPAGRRRMPAADWARGARFETDERLG